MSFLERMDQSIRRSVVWRSLFRQPYPRDERSRAYAVMNNVFLHIHPVRVRQHAVKFAYTFCLGGLSFFLFLVLTVTGVYLMFFYVPSATQAYTNILEIQSQVTFGLLSRNIHRWAAHLMVFFVFLHMMRVFYHGAYKPPREFNWVVGVVLLFLTIMLSFTGYLLPWDQIAYWAITIGTNFGSYFPIVNSPTQGDPARRSRGRPEHVAAVLRRPRDLPAADRRHLPGRPFLAHPEGRRDLGTALTGLPASRRRGWSARAFDLVGRVVDARDLDREVGVVREARHLPGHEVAGVGDPDVDGRAGRHLRGGADERRGVDPDVVRLDAVLLLDALVQAAGRPVDACKSAKHQRRIEGHEHRARQPGGRGLELAVGRRLPIQASSPMTTIRCATSPPS